MTTESCQFPTSLSPIWEGRLRTKAAIFFAYWCRSSAITPLPKLQLSLSRREGRGEGAPPPAATMRPWANSLSLTLYDKCLPNSGGRGEPCVRPSSAWSAGIGRTQGSPLQAPRMAELARWQCPHSVPEGKQEFLPAEKLRAWQLSSPGPQRFPTLVRVRFMVRGDSPNRRVPRERGQRRRRPRRSRCRGVPARKRACCSGGCCRICAPRRRGRPVRRSPTSIRYS